MKMSLIILAYIYMYRYVYNKIQIKGYLKLQQILSTYRSK